MGLNFIKEAITIGADKITDKTFTFFKQGFRLNGAIGEPEYRDVTVSGVDVLNLPNAKADGLNYCKLYGKCEQRNLPEGYTQVEYLQSSGTQYIDTGYKPNVNTEVKINFSITALPSTDAYMFHSTNGGNARVSLAITQHLVFFGDNLNDKSNRITLPEFTANTAYNITLNKNKAIVNGTEYNFTHTSVTLPTMGGIGLFGSRTGNLKCQGRVKSFSCLENNVLKINLIPARRNSDSVLGMYDTITGNFLTNAGTGTFTAGNDVVPTPTHPLNIICNNGVVKVSPNLFNINTIVENFRLSNTRGAEYGVSNDFVSQKGQFVSALIPVEEGATYLKNSITVSAYSRFKTYDANKVGVRINDTNSITIEAGEKYIAFCGYTSGVNSLQVVKGSTLPDYMPYKQVYIDGTTETVQDSLNNTATAENLYKLDNTFVDVQSVIDGVITRKVGVIALDGTEDWAYDSTYTRFVLQIANLYSAYTARTTPAYCTHYPVDSNGTPVENVPNNTAYIVYGPPKFMIKTTDYNNVTDFKNYLAQQYANGTPVIVVYPLATPATSTVTAQTLTTKKGTNTIEITQASLTDLPIEVNYMAGVSVTVQQIEDSNLDNQVTVTIGE